MFYIYIFKNIEGLLTFYNKHNHAKCGAEFNKAKK